MTTRLETELLNPLKDLYPRDGLNDSKAVIYHQQLSGLSEQHLDETFKEIVSTYERTNYPPIATILKAYKTVLARHVGEKKETVVAGDGDLEFWQAADIVARHPLAKEALERFVFRSMVTAHMNGKKAFSRRDIDEAERANKNIPHELAKMTKNHPVTQSLRKTWQTLQEKNQECVNRYLKPMEG